MFKGMADPRSQLDVNYGIRPHSIMQELAGEKIIFKGTIAYSK